MNRTAAIRTPRPITGVDLRRLPIGPEEAFVLSRVDGRASEVELSHATGLEVPRVRDCLVRLAALGAIAFDSDAPAVSAPPVSAQPVSAQPISAPVESEPIGGPVRVIELPAYDAAELEEPVDLDLARKRRILELYYRLDTLNHYQILDLPESADRKAIKNAYFEIVSQFHPDKYFGKNLGSFKTKLERVFARLTEASDTLSRSKPRQEYDDYLSTQRKTRDLERMMSAEGPQAAEIERVQHQIEAQAAAATPVGDVPQFADPEARRRALARKLRTNPPLRGSGPLPSSGPPSAKQPGGEEFKRHYEERLEAARAKQLEQYLAQVDQALTDKNLTSAANAMRIAASLCPNDPALAQRLEEIQNRAHVELAQSYIDQGQYEERSQRFVEAARSYERAARGKPTATLYERIAECLLQGNSDLRKAGEYARKAISLAPQDAGLRVTLARVYLAAGMKQSAISELERANQQFPADERAKTLLKRIKRGEV